MIARITFLTSVSVRVNRYAETEMLDLYVEHFDTNLDSRMRGKGQNLHCKRTLPKHTKSLDLCIKQCSIRGKTVPCHRHSGNLWCMLIVYDLHCLYHSEWAEQDIKCVLSDHGKVLYQSHWINRDIRATCVSTLSMTLAHSSKVHSPSEPLREWVGKENMACIYGSIIESLKRGHAISRKMDGNGISMFSWNKLDLQRQILHVVICGI